MKKIGSFFACAFFCTFTLPGDFIYYNYTLNTNLPGTNLNSIYKTFHTAYATFQPPHDVFATSTHPISTNLPWERGHYFGTHTLKPQEARVTNWSVCKLTLPAKSGSQFGRRSKCLCTITASQIGRKNQ